jgi:hypothetical protein
MMGEMGASVFASRSQAPPPFFIRFRRTSAQRLGISVIYAVMLGVVAKGMTGKGLPNGVLSNLWN